MVAPPDSGQRRARSYWVPILLALVAAGIYVNTIGSEFVYDDRHQVLENAWIRSARFLPDIFLRDVWAFRSTGVNSQYYRPLMHLVYMGEYHLFGLSRVGFHLTNVILHAVVTLGVFAVLMATLKHAAPAAGGRLAGAFLGGLLFAAHPVHVEAVAWVASVPELTFSLFCILAFLFHVRATEHVDPGASRALSILCFGLGLLAKETALVLPLLLVAYDILFCRDSWPRSLRAYAPYAVPALVWLALRFRALGFLAPPRFGDLPATAVTIFSVPALFLEYVRLIVWPVDLNAYRIAAAPSLSTSMRITALVLVIALAAVTIHIRRRAPLASFGIIWISLPLIPAVAVAMLGQDSIADRYTYFPSVGLSILVAVLVSHCWGRRNYTRFLSVVVPAVAISLCAWSAVNRNTVWRTELALWADTVKKSPQSSLVQDGLGQALLAAGRPGEAIERFRLAETLDPRVPNIHLNLGLAYVRDGRVEQALGKFLDALRLWPEYPKAHYSAGLAYWQLGNFDAAIGHLEAAARFHPEGGDAHRELGNIYLALNRFPEAFQSYTTALELAPWDSKAHNAVGVLLVRMGRIDEARAHFEQAVRLEPNDPLFRQNLERIRSRIRGR